MYSEVSYWNQRYQALGKVINYDYIASFEMLKEFLEGVMTETSCKILIVGCGNSPFSEEVYDLGYHNIINIDFSEVVINQQKEKNKSKRPDLKCKVINILIYMYIRLSSRC